MYYNIDIRVGEGLETVWVGRVTVNGYYKIITNFFDISLSKCISDIRRCLQLSIVTTREFCHFTTSLSIENTCKII